MYLVQRPNTSTFFDHFRLYCYGRSTYVGRAILHIIYTSCLIWIYFDDRHHLVRVCFWHVLGCIAVTYLHTLYGCMSHFSSNEKVKYRYILMSHEIITCSFAFLCPFISIIGLLVISFWFVGIDSDYHILLLFSVLIFFSLGD